MPLRLFLSCFVGLLAIVDPLSRESPDRVGLRCKRQAYPEKSKRRAPPILLKKDSASAPTFLSMRKRNEKKKKVQPLDRRIRRHKLVALEPLFDSAKFD
jgi:hypothetical protein